MTWLVYALLAAVLMTVINFGDKFVVESQVPNPLALIIFLSWFNLAIALILWVIVGFETIPMKETIIMLLNGTTPAFAGFFYFQAVSKTETTRIVILSQLGPVFTLILSMIFLSETLTGGQYLGFALILIAAIAVTMQRSKTKIGDVVEPVWDVLILMTFANLIYGGGLVLADSVVESLVTDFQSLLLITAYTGLGYWLGGLVLFVLVPEVRRQFMKHARTTKFKALVSLSGVESVFMLRQVVLFMALSLGSASLVSIIGSLNVFIAIFFGWMLTLWQPHIFKEDISSSNLIQKFVWAGIAFAGIILVT